VPEALARIGIIGGGAWGTALANVAASLGREVVLWAREAEVVEAINLSRRNPLYLPDVAVDTGVTATADLAAACKADAILLVTPAQHLRILCTTIAAHLGAGVPAVICAKGFEKGTGALLADVVAETLPGAVPAVLSGPTFAAEVARGLPTAVTLACRDAGVGQALVSALGGPAFRPYLTDDVTGAQVGGAVKNVLAIACGIVAGRQLGENARAALVSRGLAEMTRLGEALGARRETLMGLSGLGDLVLTCTSDKSRNTALGLAIAAGQDASAYLAGRSSVAEGAATAGAVLELAARHGVDMPICRAVDAIVNHGAAIEAEIEALLSRPFRGEGA
jgi:glycerol-3-phosphate dehydrogenase (NAD(P)+)